MNRQQAHQLLDRLDPAQFHAVAQLLEVLTAASEPFLESLSKAEFEDEVLTPETAVGLTHARESLTRGEGIAHEEILKEFGLSN